MTRTRALLAASTSVVVVLASLAMANIGPSWLRLLLALPVIALLPGYALIKAVLPDWRPGGVERLLIALGTSLSLTIIVGLALAVTPAGLTRVTWTVALAALVLVANVVAWRRSTDSERLAIPRMRSYALPLAVGVLLVAEAAALAVGVVEGGTVLPSNNDIVQLWIQWQAGKTDGSYRIGVKNVLSSTKYFRLRVVRAGVVETDTVLAVPEDGTAIVAFPPSANSTDTAPIEAALTAFDGTARQRSVTLWPRVK